MEPSSIQTECSSLVKVAKAFSVSLSVVRKWRKECDALSANRKPYDLADVAWYLLVNRLITPDDITHNVKCAMASSLADEAFTHGSVSRLVAKLNHDELNHGNIDAAVKKAWAAAAKATPLLPEESAVIAIASPKTAALFVDRIWTLDKHVPPEIELDFGTAEETMFRGFISAGIDRALRVWFGKDDYKVKLEADDEIL